MYCEANKLHPFYFLNNFVKSRSILIIFGAQIPEWICNKTLTTLSTCHDCYSSSLPCETQLNLTFLVPKLSSHKISPKATYNPVNTRTWTILRDCAQLVLTVCLCACSCGWNFQILYLTLVESHNWRAPWKNRTSRSCSYFHSKVFLFPAHHSVVIYFQCSVYWWKVSVRF